MKIKEYDNHLYSRENFEQYKLRFILELIDINQVYSKTDIYTTNPNIKSIEATIPKMITSKVSKYKIIHHATREQDDISSKFIDGWLNEIEKNGN